MTPPSLNELPSHAEALPSLPEVVSYLMHSFKDDSADVDTIAHHINSDPAIVARLLAAANSAATGLSTHIYSAKQAFMVLGAFFAHLGFTADTIKFGAVIALGGILLLVWVWWFDRAPKG